MFTGGPSSSCEMIILRNNSHGGIIRVCMGIFTTAPRNKKIRQTLNKNISPYFQSVSLVIWPLNLMNRAHLSELFISRFSTCIRNQRGSTEVCIEQISSSSGLRYSISSHGCEYSLTNMIDLLGLEKRALGERVHKILEFVDSSALCSGVDINETTSASMSPHVSGEYRHNDNVLFKVFSKQCHIIQCSDGISCANCRKINDWMTNQRKGSYLGMQFIPLPTKDTWQGMS